MRRLARQYLDEIKVNAPNIDAEAERLSGGQGQSHVEWNAIMDLFGYSASEARW